MKEDLRAHLLRFCNSYERLPAILKRYSYYKKKRKTAEWFKILGEEWAGFDNVGAFAKKLKRILLCHRGLWKKMMSPKEQRAFSKLPKTLTIYRGAGPKNLLGLSWTLSKTTAKRFPFLTRYRQETPLLAAAKVTRAQVVLVKAGRAEREIVAIVAKENLLMVETL